MNDNEIQIDEGITPEPQPAKAFKDMSVQEKYAYLAALENQSEPGVPILIPPEVADYFGFEDNNEPVSLAEALEASFDTDMAKGA